LKALKKFLIIQTAFTGDVILATSVAEKLHQHFPDAQVDFLLRKGNESLLHQHPFIHEIIIWNKKKNKFSNFLKIILKVKQNHYGSVINLHRFASSGLITVLSGAKEKIGFDKNPFSFFFTKRFKHTIGNGQHEIERNHSLIKDFTDNVPAQPKLYPSKENFNEVIQIKNPESEYICIAPASVWFTKQLPKEKWIEFISLLPGHIPVFLIGSKEDFKLCESIKSEIQSGLTGTKSGMVFNLAGKLSFLQSAALMKNALMNYVNDSAPLHMASAMNASVTAVFCSTIPAFGFGPLSDDSNIVETKIKLDCKPCGLHGYRACPLGHFKCAWTIEVNDLIGSMNSKFKI
jgi:ADP-heptose:LPS heptosyltransferase